MRPSGEIKFFIVFIKASRLFIGGKGGYEKNFVLRNKSFKVLSIYIFKAQFLFFENEVY